jgi:hypothetical protein
LVKEIEQILQKREKKSTDMLIEWSSSNMPLMSWWISSIISINHKF